MYNHDNGQPQLTERTHRTKSDFPELKPKKRGSAKKLTKRISFADDFEPSTNKASERQTGTGTHRSKANDLLSFDVANFGPDFFCRSPRDTPTPGAEHNPTPTFQLLTKNNNHL